MNIVCPNCEKAHKLPDDKITFTKAAANCKRCGVRMIITPEQSTSDGSLPGSGKAQPESFEIDGPEVLLTQEHLDGEPPFDIEQEELPDEVNEGGSEQLNDHDLFAVFPGLRKFSPQTFDFQQIFTDSQRKGYGTKDNLLKFRVVRAVHDILTTKILNENEKVLRVAKGTAYFPFEIPYANGIFTLLSNYFAIICTDQRMILINVNPRIDHPTRYIFQVLYDEIEDLGRGVFLSSVIVQTRTGRNWNLTTVRRQHAKEIAEFVAEIKRRGPSGLYDGISRWQCCPGCYTPLPGGLAGCPSCSAVFKSPKESLFRALSLPGLGVLYLGYLPLALVEMLGYLAVWLVAVVLLVLKVPGGIITAILLVLAYHALIGIISYKMAGKGYLLQAVSDKSVTEAHHENPDPASL